MTAPVGMAARLAAVLAEHAWLTTGKCRCGVFVGFAAEGPKGIAAHQGEAVAAALASEATDPAPRHNHDPIGLYANCPACGTVIPPDPAPEGDREWPCADFKAPITCLTTPKPKTLLCHWCRAIPDAARIQALYATDPPAGETATEWGVRDRVGLVIQVGDERCPEVDLESGDTHVSRERTRFPDRVTEWQPADPEEGR